MKRTGAKYLIISLCLALLLALIAGCSLPDLGFPQPSTPEAPTATAPPPTPINPTWTPPQPEKSGVALPSFADTVERVQPSVVAINTEIVALDFFNRPLTQKGAGSGWVLDSSGIIVTNNHVIEDAKTITVVLDDGRTFNVDASSVFTDKLNDLAVLKINAANLRALKVGDSSRIRVGDWVLAIGNALGQGIRATAGIVSRKGVELEVDQGQNLYDLIETNAAINPGNSGGPLVNLAGEVIGITSAKVSTIGVEGMGYAISSNTAIPIIEALVQKGYVTRPWLGVELRTIDQFLALRYNLSVDTGVLVTRVSGGSPAEKAGLASGDIIISAAGKDVASAEELVRRVHTSQIGQPLPLVIWRSNSQSTVQVVPIESPPPG